MGAFGLLKPQLDLASALKSKCGRSVIFLWSPLMCSSASSQIARFYMEIFTLHGRVVS